MKIPQLAIKKLEEVAAAGASSSSPAGSRRGSRRPSLVVTAAPGQPGSRRDSIIMDLAVSQKLVVDRIGFLPFWPTTKFGWF